LFVLVTIEQGVYLNCHHLSFPARSGQATPTFYFGEQTSETENQGSKYFLFSFVLTQKKQKVKTAKKSARISTHYIKINELIPSGFKQHLFLSISLIEIL